MATATPSARWGSRAGWGSASCEKSCFTEVAERRNSATPPVSCARFPTSTTRGMRDSDLVEAALLERLQHLGRRHRQLGEADAGGALHGVGDRPQWRDDRRLADPAHALRGVWAG